MLVKSRYGSTAIILIIILFVQSASSYVYGESSPEETQAILQKTLSIVEIDHEIERITEKQQELAEQHTSLSAQS